MSYWASVIMTAVIMAALVVGNGYRIAYNNNEKRLIILVKQEWRCSAWMEDVGKTDYVCIEYTKVTNAPVWGSHD